MTSFVFQQPGSAKLLDAIAVAADGAEAGGGVFAFASTSGVEALFGVPTVTRMLVARKLFHLVVGVDAITNAEALLCIADKQAKYRGALSSEVFLHEHPASTFHPKFIWFMKDGKLHLITGSGNLTLRGVGQQSAAAPAPGNWEAFSVQTISQAEATTISRMLSDWLAAQRAAGALRSLDDESVKTRAMTNGLTRYTSGPVVSARTAAGTRTTQRAFPVDDVTFEAKDILVRELPKNRHGQADVGKNALSDFFGFSGTSKNILLQYVSTTDQLGPTEKIRLFVNESQNYRLELHAIRGLSYDIAADDSRMILVATKLDRRSFRYTIVPITAAAHTSLITLLGPISIARRLMREKRVTSEELRQYWGSAPTNLVPVSATSPPP